MQGVEGLHAKLRGRLKVFMQFWSSTCIKFNQEKVASGAIIVKVAELTILGKTKNNYFASNYPHHDIYTFCYWQIFWHSI